MCFQAKPIFEKLNEEAGELAKNEKFKASNVWFSRFKSRLKASQKVRGRLVLTKKLRLYTQKNSR